VSSTNYDHHFTIFAHTMSHSNSAQAIVSTTCTIASNLSVVSNGHNVLSTQQTSTSVSASITPRTSVRKGK